MKNSDHVKSNGVSGRRSFLRASASSALLAPLAVGASRASAAQAQTRIEMIAPVVLQPGFKPKPATRQIRPDLTVTRSFIPLGPASVESEFDEAISVPGIVRKAIDAERSGAHAVIINCMGDPGLHACREAVSIPVVGPCECAMHVAAMLGSRFAFVTVLPRLRGLIDRIVAQYGLSSAYASFRAVNIPVLELERYETPALAAALAREAVPAIVEDEADTVILGCTGFSGLGEAVRKILVTEGHDVPVIDPTDLAIHYADALVSVRLSHSKRRYPAPSRKRITGYDFPELDV